MPRGFKRDISATDEAYAAGRLIDRKHRSFVSQPKAIPGECDEPKPHLILWGADATAQRMNLFRREKNRCQVCKLAVVWGGEDNDVQFVGQWHHIRKRAGQRCDCLVNARLLCAACHSGEHAERKPRWTADLAKV